MQIKNNILVFTILCISVFLFPSIVIAKTSTKEWIEEDNDVEQPIITVVLKAGETTTNKITSTIVSGNIKENDEDEIYDYTKTTVIERFISATVSTLTTTVIEQGSSINGLNLVYDKNKKELYTSYFDRPSDVAVKTPAPEGYDYQFVGLGDYSAQIVSFVNVKYAKDKNGKTLKDENGNYIIESLTTQEGEIVTRNGEAATNLDGLLDNYSGIVVVQALLENEEGNAIYAYCVDIEIDGNLGSWYSIANLEDNNYYASKDAEKHIRTILMNGYWGTASDADNNGKYDMGSLDLLKQQLKNALARGEIDKEVTVTYKEDDQVITKTFQVTNELIDGLTEGEALDMTQAAIWVYSNGSQAVQDGRDGWIVVNPAYGDTAAGNRKRKTNDPEGMARMTVLYNWLVNLESKESSTVVINEKNYVEDFNLTIGNKVSDNIYEASLNFTLSYEPNQKDDLVIYFTYEDENGESQTIARRISGELKPGEVQIEKNGSNYVIDGLNLKENTDLEFSLRLEGYQYLELGAYIFNAEGGLKASQTLVGVASGEHNVNINRDLMIKFNVDDNNKYTEKRYWKDKGYEELPPNTGIIIDEKYTCHNVIFILEELLTY